MQHKEECHFLIHLTRKLGTGAAVVEGLQNAIEEMDIADKITAVGGAITASNTGHKEEQYSC